MFIVPTKPVVGYTYSATKSGVHVDGMLKDRRPTSRSTQAPLGRTTSWCSASTRAGGLVEARLTAKGIASTPT